MVDVDDRATFMVGHGRQFVHPLPVIAVVVGVDAADRPTVKHQFCFDVVQVLVGHQQVDVAEQPPVRGATPTHRIGRALQQNHGQVQSRQGLLEMGAFPCNGQSLMLAQAQGRHDVWADLRGQSVEQPTLLDLAGDSPGQVGAARRSEGLIPALEVERLQTARVAQEMDQRQVEHRPVCATDRRRPASQRPRARHRGDCR